MRPTLVRDHATILCQGRRVAARVTVHQNPDLTLNLSATLTLEPEPQIWGCQN